MCTQKFYICEVCGNLTALINDTGMPLMCCGQDMTELIPNTVDAAREKHIPTVTISGDILTIKVGSVEHPMTAEHHIEFIYIQSEYASQRQCLKIGDKPVATFKMVGQSQLEVFAYCNLHGLWKMELEGWGTDDAICSAEFTEGCI